MPNSSASTGHWKRPGPGAGLGQLLRRRCPPAAAARALRKVQHQDAGQMERDGVRAGHWRGAAADDAHPQDVHLAPPGPGAVPVRGRRPLPPAVNCDQRGHPDDARVDPRSLHHGQRLHR
uniref:(northern house mosquito) hypothetical protein n=1 Tax=Culex pipiens TaxID=7175 RepID=A0A8D8IBN1_CULPI